MKFMMTIISAVILFVEPANAQENAKTTPGTGAAFSQGEQCRRNIDCLRRIELKISQLQELVAMRVFGVTRLEVSSATFTASVIDSQRVQGGEANLGRAFCRVSGFHVFVGYQWDGPRQTQTSPVPFDIENYGNLVAIICANPRMHHESL